MNEDLKNYLAKLGFNNEEIEEISIFANNDIDTRELKNKVEYLISIGCTPRIVRIVIEENPLFMTTEFSKVSKVVDYLKSIGLSEDLIEIIEIEPYILSTSLDTIQRNYKMLEMLINKEFLNIICKDRIEILTYTPDYLSDRLAYLVDNGLKEKIYDIIINNIEIFEQEIDEIDIENLKK